MELTRIDQSDAVEIRASGRLDEHWAGHLSEGLDWLAALLARDAGTPPTLARAWALGFAAKLASHHCDDADGQRLAREFLALPQALQVGPAAALAQSPAQPWPGLSP